MTEDETMSDIGILEDKIEDLKYDIEMLNGEIDDLEWTIDELRGQVCDAERLGRQEILENVVKPIKNFHIANHKRSGFNWRNCHESPCSELHDI